MSKSSGMGRKRRGIKNSNILDTCKKGSKHKQCGNHKLKKITATQVDTLR